MGDQLVVLFFSIFLNYGHFAAFYFSQWAVQYIYYIYELWNSNIFVRIIFILGNWNNIHIYIVNMYNCTLEMTCRLMSD